MDELISVDDMISIIKLDPLFAEYSDTEYNFIYTISNNNELFYDEIELIKNLLYKTHIGKRFLYVNKIVCCEQLFVFDAPLIIKYSWYTNNKILKIRGLYTDPITNTNYKNIKNESSQENSIFYRICDEILEKILVDSFEIRTFNFVAFLELRYVCKRFFRIFNTDIFIKKCLININPVILLSIKNKFTNMNLIPFNHFSNIVYFYSYNLIKHIFITLYGECLIDAIGGFDKFIALPNISLHHTCIFNLCGSNCIHRFHNILPYIDSPVTRGIDDLGNPFILFIYKTHKKYLFEIIYKNKNECDNITFSGVGFNTYIGNLSVNYSEYYSTSYRTLHYSSFDYIKRLVNNDPTGQVHYCSHLNMGIEYLYLKVKLAFNRTIIETQIHTFTNTCID